MAIDKKLILFKTRKAFDASYGKGDIANTSVVFIEDTGELWTNGKLYCKTNGSDHNHDNSYLPINGTAADSLKLGNIEASYYVKGNNSTGTFEAMKPEELNLNRSTFFWRQYDTADVDFGEYCSGFHTQFSGKNYASQLALLHNSNKIKVRFNKNNEWQTPFEIYTEKNSNISTVDWTAKDFIGTNLILSGNATIAGNQIWHAGNSNKSDVDWTCAQLNVSRGIFGSRHQQIVNQGDNDNVFINHPLGGATFIEGKDYNNSFVKDSGGKIWNAGNSNRDDVDWTAKNLIGTNLTINKGSINLNFPIEATGGWARGIFFSDSNNRFGGFGVFGSGETKHRISLSFGENWWDSNGMHITPDNNFGFGIFNPKEKIEINGNIKATSFIGNVTGNVSGSSGSCTGNAATVTNGVYTNTDQTITGKKTFSVQQAFSVAQGTAPFTVTSNIVVTNLNSNYLEGFGSSSFWKKSELEIGGRNYALNSTSFSAGGGAPGITGSINSDGSLSIVATSGNGNWFTSFCSLSGVEDNFIEGETFTISFEMKAIGTTNKPKIYLKSGMGYFEMLGTLSTEYSTIYYTGVWKKTNPIALHFGMSSTIGTLTVKNVKVEKGNIPTKWCPAWEDKADISALNLKADLASPTFTGTPLAPTAAAKTNTTQIATTAFVRKEVSDLVNGAPETLDTLAEIAAYLTDGNVAGSIVQQLAAKVSKAGDTLTGRLLFNNCDGIAITSDNKDLSLLKVFGSAEGTWGFDIKYMGTGSGNDNSLRFICDNQTGTKVNALDIKQNGDIIGGALFNSIGGLQVNGVNVSLTGHTHNELVGVNYTSGGNEKPKDFGAGKLRYQMLGKGTQGTNSIKGGIPSDNWTDAIWLSAYGNDVPNAHVLLFGKYSNSVGFRKQRHDAETWGAYYEFFHTGNSNLSTIDWSAKSLTLAGSITGATTIDTDTITSNLIKSGSRDIISPKGGIYTTTTSTCTGAIKITLPASIGNTMVSMWIDVYNYVSNTSFSVHCGGYTFNNSTWSNNPFAMVYGADHTVRLSCDGTNFFIHIGELNSTWSYPQIKVRDLILGYNASTNWFKDFSIGFEATAFPSSNVIINHKAWTSKNFNPNNYSLISHTHTDYASTITTTGSGNAITSLSINGNIITADKGNSFLSLSGGRITSIEATPLHIYKSSGSVNLNIAFQASTHYTRYLGFATNGVLKVGDTADLNGYGNIIWHDGNSNKSDVDWNCQNLKIPYAGSIIDSQFNRIILTTGFSPGLGDHFILSTTGTSNTISILKGISNGSLTWNDNKIWHEGNSGSGSGLDADMLDGLHVHTGRNNEANKIVRTDNNGYILAGYINSEAGNENNNFSPDRVWGSNATDAYLRTYRTSALSVDNSAKLGGIVAANLKPKVSIRDFTNGTLIRTSIDYSQSGGAAWVLKIHGNIYGNGATLNLQAQGYIYNNTIINTNGTFSGTFFTGANDKLVAMNIDGKLCFWFGRQGYWCGYNVECYNVSSATTYENLVTSIEDLADPVGTKRVTIPLYQIYSGANPNIGTGEFNYAAGNHTHNYAGSSSVGGVATKSYVSEQIEAFTGDDFSGGNHYLKAIRYDGWHTRLYMGYHRDGTKQNTVHVGYADSAISSNYTGFVTPKYDGGVILNPQQYFNRDTGLRVAMTGATGSQGDHWGDTLWINGYAGTDVPNCCALHFSRHNARMFLSLQDAGGTSYGTLYEVYHKGNLDIEGFANRHGHVGYDFNTRELNVHGDGIHFLKYGNDAGGFDGADIYLDNEGNKDITKLIFKVGDDQYDSFSFRVANTNPLNIVDTGININGDINVSQWIYGKDILLSGSLQAATGISSSADVRAGSKCRIVSNYENEGWLQMGDGDYKHGVISAMYGNNIDDLEIKANKIICNATSFANNGYTKLNHLRILENPHLDVNGFGIDLGIDSGNSRPIVGFNDSRTSADGYSIRIREVEAMAIKKHACFSNAWNTYSDIRLKNNIVDLENSLDKLMKISAKRFNYNDGLQNQMGVIAQELNILYPELVNQNNGYLSVNYIGLIPVLTKALQELTEKVKKLESKLYGTN